MFRFVFVLVGIIVCSQSVTAGNIHHQHQGASYGLSSSIIASGGHGGHGHQGQSSLINSVGARRIVSTPIVSSYSTSIVHPDSLILRPVVNHHGHNSQIVPQHQHYHQHQQQQQHHVISPVTHHLPALSQSQFLGHANAHHNTNSYAIQSSYTGPLVTRGIHSAPHVSAQNFFSRW